MTHPPAPDDLPRAAITGDTLPRYVEVATHLRDDLRRSEARAGDRLPSERVLVDRYAVSRVTVRSALGELHRRGVIAPSASRGWFVSEDQRMTPAPHVQGFADWAAERGLAATARVLEHRVRPATVTEAETFRVAPGAPVLDLRRVRSVEGLVVVLEHNLVPASSCPALADADFASESLYATLATAEPPMVARVADYAVEARLPDAEEVRLLEIDDAAPVLAATQLSYDAEGRPMEQTTQVFRGDRYRFEGSITNPG